MVEQQRTHLDRIKEHYTFEEILEMNDIDEPQMLDLLWDLGYLLYPEDRTPDIEEPEVRNGYNG